jgi:hypothetical protein
VRRIDADKMAQAMRANDENY